MKLNVIKTMKLGFFAIALSMTVTSCELGGGEQESELITTVRWTLTPVGGGSAVELLFKDTDGDGGNAPTVTGGVLKANTEYNGSLIVLDESDPNAIEDITTEIKEEDEDHQFFYEIGTGLTGVIASYTDQDANQKPVGLTSKIVTKNASKGTIKITLRHKPNKSATNVANGDITNAGGETDVEVNFSVEVK
jgi:hypothetical protein